MGQYAHPEALVETAWVAEHGNDPHLRIVEVDVDTAAYEKGHIPGAIAWNWTTQLCDTVQRDIIPKDKLEQLMADSGVDESTDLILYGDNNNWFAAWALWQLKIYGHADVRLMNGGRKKWIAEGRELTTEVPTYAKTVYRAKEPDLSIRAFLPEVQRALEARSHELVDVPGRVQRRDPRAPWAPGDLSARRPHTGREEHSLGNGLQRGRQLQAAGRAR
jgi:thiosulfate/3-mercaptopyruvate sulfurtransferase